MTSIATLANRDMHALLREFRKVRGRLAKQGVALSMEMKFGPLKKRGTGTRPAPHNFTNEGD